MKSVHALHLRVCVSVCLIGWMANAQALDWRVVVLSQANNPALDRSRVERGYLGHATGTAMDGLAMAMDDARFELDAARTDVKIEPQEVATLDAARAAAKKAEAGGAHIIVTELPATWTAAAAAAVSLPVVNVLAADDALRAQDCKLNLFHTIPSERMRADAMAQALVARKWASVLLLVGSAEEDLARSAAVSGALKRYGLKVIAQKAFKLSADPRERALANPLLLTAGVTYDVVWVVDSQGEFARGLPYNLSLPRPVVGDAGMVALAWHHQFERYGAPQASRRLAKAAKRFMTGHDWASWMAGKAIAALATSQPKPNAKAALQALGNMVLDGSKGVPMAFRNWDRQLRQPLLLSDGQGVVGMAPLEGVLHPSNNLDSLGADAPERLCRATQ
jgi:ABC transporter substrate binding protein (PQQ-dependent alcohol dehydrogenase system)